MCGKYIEEWFEDVNAGLDEDVDANEGPTLEYMIFSYKYCDAS